MARLSSHVRERTRTAVLAMVCCRTAWNWARRDKPEIIPTSNPFAGVDMGEYKAKPTRPVTHCRITALREGRRRGRR